MDVTIVAEHETHLLIAQGDRFAVIEQRNNQLYSCHDGQRVGIPLDELVPHHRGFDRLGFRRPAR
jgi:hypothetical protein